MGRRHKAWLHGSNGIRYDKGRQLPGYYARWSGHTADGHRINHTRRFLRQHEAQRWVRRFNARLDLDTDDIIPIDLRDAGDEFIAGCSTLAHDTVIHYGTAIGRLRALISDKATCEIDGADIDLYITTCLSHASEATAAKHIRSLRRFFNWCRGRHYVTGNPIQAATVLPPDGAIRARPPVSETQLSSIIEALATEDRRLAVWLAMTTGLDRKIIESLCTAQIDTNTGSIRIRRPKTKRRGRPIVVAPIHAAIAPALYARLCESDPAKPLLVGLARQRADRDWWKLATKRAGVPDLLFRDLRAVAAARLQRLGGLTLADAQHLLGHASPQTTAAHYYVPDPKIAQAVHALPLPGHRPPAAKTTEK